MLCFCPKRLGPTRRRTQLSKDREELEVPRVWSAPATVSPPSDSSPPPCRGRNPSAPPHVFTSTPTRRLRLYALCRPRSRPVSSPPPHPPDPPTSPARGNGYDTFLSYESACILNPQTPPTAATSRSTTSTSIRRVRPHPYSAGTSTTCADDRDEHGGRKSASSSSNSLSSLGSKCSAVGGQDGDDEQYGRVVESASTDAESFRCAGAAALERAWEAKRLALVLATGL